MILELKHFSHLRKVAFIEQAEVALLEILQEMGPILLGMADTSDLDSTSLMMSPRCWTVL